MTKKQMGADAGVEKFGDSNCSRSDIAVNHDGDVTGGAGEAYTGHRGNFEAADGAHQRDSVSEASAMAFERRSDHFGLTPQANVVETGAAPDDFRGRDSGRGAENGGCGGAVADTHLANADQRHALIGNLIEGGDTNFDRCVRLLDRHRGAVEEVTRARADASIDDVQQGRITTIGG